MSRSASERAFRTDLQNAAQSAGFHVIPIPDMPRVRGTRFSVARVYDLGLVDETGAYHGIECKQVRTGYGWSFAEMSEDQEANLLDAARLGFGWLIIHHVARLSAAQAKRWKRDNLDRAWAVPIHAALQARDREGRNTLKPEWCDQHGIRLMERGEWYWLDFVDHVALEMAVGASTR